MTYTLATLSVLVLTLAGAWAILWHVERCLGGLSLRLTSFF